MMPASDTHMHEGLISREPVMKSRNSHVIFSRYNVVPRHDKCPEVEVVINEEPTKIVFSHGGGIGGDVPFERCARYLCKYEGYDAVVTWLQEMALEIPTAGSSALRRFMGLRLEFDSALMMAYEARQR